MGVKFPEEGYSDAYVRENGPLLWHYTSQHGLLGILQERGLWLTDIRFLNDSREYEYAALLAQGLLDIRRRAAPDQLQPCLTHLHSAVVKSSVGSVRSFYTFSLSSEQDDLSQWRAYSPQGAGFALGFESRRLTWLARCANARLVECTYDHARHLKEINDLIETTVQSHLASLARQTETPALLDAVAEVFADSFVELATRMEHYSFAGEREWRIIAQRRHRELGHRPEIGPEGPRLRPGRSVPIPYTSLSIHHDNEFAWPIHRVTIGPTQFPQQAIRAVALAFDAARVRSAFYQVHLSETPFRAWW